MTTASSSRLLLPTIIDDTTILDFNPITTTTTTILNQRSRRLRVYPNPTFIYIDDQVMIINSAIRFLGRNHVITNYQKDESNEKTGFRYLKIKEYSTSNSDQEDQCEDEEVCVVCQTEYSDGEKMGCLDCGHLFHSNCIKKWLLRKNLCPLCKSVALTCPPSRKLQEDEEM